MSDTYVPAALRREVVARAAGCCEYCLVTEASQAVGVAIDHVIAAKHGGRTTSENLCLSCYWCNTYKGSDISSVDWASGGVIIPLYNPRKDRWSDHFILDGAQIRPRTATGRVTVSLLRLDSPERIEERDSLLALGDYPCAAQEIKTR